MISNTKPRQLYCFKKKSKCLLPTEIETLIYTSIMRAQGLILYELLPIK